MGTSFSVELKCILNPENKIKQRGGTVWKFKRLSGNFVKVLVLEDLLFCAFWAICVMLFSYLRSEYKTLSNVNNRSERNVYFEERTSTPNMKLLRKKSSLKSIRLFVDPISSLPLTKRLSLSLSSFKGNAINKKVCLMMSVQCLWDV